jgi:hypothetical protein
MGSTHDWFNAAPAVLNRNFDFVNGVQLLRVGFVLWNLHIVQKKFNLRTGVLSTASLDYPKLPPPIRRGRRGLWGHSRKRCID